MIVEFSFLDITVDKGSIDFIKNVSNKAKAKPEKTRPTIKSKLTLKNYP